MTTETTILITGADRGIGRAITTTYLSRPYHTIIALVRDPTNSTSQSLLTELKDQTTNLIILPYDASLPCSAEFAISLLTT